MAQSNLDSPVPEALTQAAANRLFWQTCNELIVRHQYRRVCDIGGGRSPAFSPADIERLKVDYTILDVSQKELSLAPSGYGKIAADICDAKGEGLFDLMFSAYVAEHVRDGTAMHKTVLRLLAEGGRAVHLIPTLFSPAFVINRLMPYSVGLPLVQLFLPEYRGSTRFPARYSKCFGPTSRMKRFFNGLGYQVEEYKPFYGTYYFKHMPLLRTIDRRITGWAAKRLNPYLTSYALIVLLKPPHGAPQETKATTIDAGAWATRA